MEALAHLPSFVFGKSSNYSFAVLALHVRLMRKRFSNWHNHIWCWIISWSFPNRKCTRQNTSNGSKIETSLLSTFWWTERQQHLNDKINVLVLKSLYFFGNYHENLMEMSMNLSQGWVNSEQTYYTREHTRKWTNHTLEFK